MKPLRFLVFFSMTYLLGTLMSFFFAFAARLIQDDRIFFIPFVSIILLNLFFGWLYFKGIDSSVGWRARVEAMAVWLMLGMVLDVLVLLFIYKKSFADLSYFTPLGYGLKALVLFVAAYVTADAHPRLTAPNLVLHDDLSSNGRV
ncbi:hypothetical protein A3B32_03290 [Candidatus Uhrbacteria bacterium RIFCSPLOWO2_01_FULL_53_9]|uniref:Uncharacterized protein n=3 Tax=Candidatus Uhriibacteriota TaxID=1752732 RepID=A0A1F7UYH9_9BACT|nr:MAG: hypothetical protein A3C17_03690 [Candidatus Uhrbacteria bacterium RIFCSPHIGHO2_02_FULL_53_13]OGL83311.1 MAG: hypothetical protein A3B32_03290 [Candidatus Uhrbacteria bacterium RIFCSPLOWO2_01_FULL_53_9]OGL90184.1 MAG: hypothetical protein A3I45_02390 [Candidatus Uhrbacteria bacterium RIFCSPLOWO2_02_FULL_53_10]